MNEISEETIQRILSKMYRDAKIKKSNNDHLILHYNKKDWTSLIPENSVNAVINYLSWLKYQGKPFVMSVSQIQDDKFEMIVRNPNR